MQVFTSDSGLVPTSQCSTLHPDTSDALAHDIRKDFPAPGLLAAGALAHGIRKDFPAPGLLAAGISCQPYSKLGNRQAGNDPRSRTLPGVLRLGFRARFPVIMLECVCEAHTCPWVQQVLRKFVELTGYHLTQGELYLQQTWAARRSRWWCVLSHPSLGKILGNLRQRFSQCRWFVSF